MTEIKQCEGNEDWKKRKEEILSKEEGDPIYELIIYGSNKDQRIHSFIYGSICKPVDMTCVIQSILKMLTEDFPKEFLEALIALALDS